MAQDPRIYAVEHRNSAGTLLDRWENITTGLSWEWLSRGGCGVAEFSLPGTFSSYTISADDDIKIWQKDTTAATTGKLVYRGYITQIERSIGGDGERINITCSGYFSKLRRYIVSDSGAVKTYESQSIDAIVEDIINNYAIPNSTPTLTLGTVDDAPFSPDSIEFKQPISDCLNTLAQLLGNIEYGIDETLTFFWKTESNTVNNTFLMGKDIASYSELTDFDGDEFVNKIYFEGNTLDDAVFTAFGSNAGSQSAYGLRERIVTNSSINTTSTANQIMNALLLMNSRPKVRIAVSAPNQIVRFEDSEPMGAVQILDALTDQLSNIWGNTADGGSDLTWGNAADLGSDKVWGTVPFYQIERVKYTPNGVDGYCDLEMDLGGMRYETPALLDQIENNLNSVRQRQI